MGGRPPILCHRLMPHLAAISTLARDFRPFSLMHLVSVLICAAVIFVIVRLGQRARDRHRDAPPAPHTYAGLPADAGPATPRTGARLLGSVGLALWLLHQTYTLLFVPHLHEAVPLHICDIAALLGPIGLLTGYRPFRTVTYFWAVGLTIWGLLTPTLNQGPAHPTFWIFWLNHASVLLYGIYEVAVLRYRPSARDFGLACLVSLAYAALIIPFNLAYDWDFGYLGRGDPDNWTPLELLPPWPWRILAVELLGLLMLAYGWLPWEIARRWRGLDQTP